MFERSESMKIVAIGMNVYRVSDRIFKKLTKNDFSIVNEAGHLYDKRHDNVAELMGYIEQYYTPILVLDEALNY